MIQIDDAGTGCIIGEPIIVGEKDGNVEYLKMKDLKGVRAFEEVFELIDKMGVDKDEEIQICRGNVFDMFCHEAKLKGYTNIKRVAIEGLFQDTAEDIFMESLYNLGLSREVKLVGKKYSRLHEDIKMELIKNTSLLEYVRPHYLMSESYTELLRRIEGAHNQFPNLILKGVILD